jgi:hypothetical protein
MKSVRDLMAWPQKEFVARPQKEAAKRKRAGRDALLQKLCRPFFPQIWI